MGSEQRRSKKHRPSGIRKSGPAQRKLGTLRKGDRIADKFHKVDTTKRIADIARGVPVGIACAAVGVSDQTFYNWLDKRPEFAEALAIKKQETILEWLSVVLAGAKERDWRGAAWALERCYPDAFAPKPQMALGVQNNTFMIGIEKAREIEQMRMDLLPKVNARLGLTNGSKVPGSPPQ